MHQVCDDFIVVDRVDNGRAIISEHSLPVKVATELFFEVFIDTVELTHKDRDSVSFALVRDDELLDILDGEGLIIARLVRGSVAVMLAFKQQNVDVPVMRGNCRSGFPAKETVSGVLSHFFHLLKNGDSMHLRQIGAKD